MFKSLKNWINKVAARINFKASKQNECSCATPCPCTLTSTVYLDSKEADSEYKPIPGPLFDECYSSQQLDSFNSFTHEELDELLHNKSKTTKKSQRIDPPKAQIKVKMPTLKTPKKKASKKITPIKKQPAKKKAASPKKKTK